MFSGFTDRYKGEDEIQSFSPLRGSGGDECPSDSESPRGNPVSGFPSPSTEPLVDHPRDGDNGASTDLNTRQQDYLSATDLDRAIHILRKKVSTQVRPPFLEKKSVYGAAILIPQLARSAGWHMDLCALTLKVYFFLFLNFIVQFMLLAAIEKEETVMDLFSGQMYLCDFGAPIDECPESPSCLGPGGSQISAPRLYSYQSWALKTFFKDSLKAVFPEREAEVEQMVDPGEYGAESREIRWLCCFIFMMDVMTELENIANMCSFLYSVPTAAQPWIDVHEDTEDHEFTDEAKMTKQASEGKEVLRVKVAGIPLIWKVVSVIFILVPKALLWRLTAEAGICFLMETAAIDDMIVNAVALGFILQIDESICENLMSATTQELLEECDDDPAHLHGEPQQGGGPDVVPNKSFLHMLIGCVPMRLVTAVLLSVLFMLKYYTDHCNWKSDGHWWASKEMHLPESTDYTVLNTLFPFFFPIRSEKEPYWHLGREVNE